MDEGVIKYSSERIDGLVTTTSALDELNAARTALFDLNLIGVYPNGIGYGNGSLRAAGLQFIISASATGSVRHLAPEQYCLVEAFSIDRNWVRSRGRLAASSESMTHGAIYSANPAVHCVLHVHHRRLFDSLLLQGAARTSADVPYGTPAMARAVTQLIQAQTALPVLFAMAGHDEGVVAYGSGVSSTVALLLDTFKRIQLT